jgi:hypothetical protein
MAHLITGRAGYAHVTAADEAKINKALYGDTEAVVKYGNNLAITMPSSNTVVIDTGLIYMQGRWIDIPSAESLSYENGNAGMNRRDLVVLQYSADPDTGVETAKLIIKKGTPSAEATDPELTTGDIDNGALVNEMPLYRISLTGINAGDPEKLFKVMYVRADVDSNGNIIPDTYAKKTELGDQIKIVVSGTKCTIAKL